MQCARGVAHSTTPTSRRRARSCRRTDSRAAPRAQRRQRTLPRSGSTRTAWRQNSQTSRRPKRQRRRVRRGSRPSARSCGPNSTGTRNHRAQRTARCSCRPGTRRPRRSRSTAVARSSWPSPRDTVGTRIACCARTARRSRTAAAPGSTCRGQSSRTCRRRRPTSRPHRCTGTCAKSRARRARMGFRRTTRGLVQPRPPARCADCSRQALCRRPRLSASRAPR